MTLLDQLIAYNPYDYAKRYRVFSAVGTEPRNLGLIADRAKVNDGDAINHILELEDAGLVICHREANHEWRLAHA